MPSDNEENPARGELVREGSTNFNDDASSQNATTSRVHGDADEAALLRNITADIRDQDDLERDITAQANAALIEAEDKKDKQRIEKLEATKVQLETKRGEQRKKLEATRRNPYQARIVQKEIDKLDLQIEQATSDISDFQTRIDKRREEAAVVADDTVKNKSRRLPGESHREFLVRTGKITPFANLGGERPAGFEGELADVLIEAEEDAAEKDFVSDTEEPKSHQVLRMPGFAEEREVESAPVESEFSLRPRKKRKVQREGSSDDFEPTTATSPESQYASDTSEEEATGRKRRKGKKKQATGNTVAVEGAKVDLSGVDDGNETGYQARLADWVKRRSRARQRRAGTDGDILAENDGEEEWFKPSPDHPDHIFGNDLKLPGDIHPSLFDYQKTGVHWLAELYEQGVGGIIGDEMGLGKTGNVMSQPDNEACS